MQYKIGSYGKIRLGDSLIKSMYAILSPNAATTTIRDLINLDEILENTQDNIDIRNLSKSSPQEISLIFFCLCDLHLCLILHLSFLFLLLRNLIWLTIRRHQRLGIASFFVCLLTVFVVNLKCTKEQRYIDSEFIWERVIFKYIRQIYVKHSGREQAGRKRSKFGSA